MCCLMFVSVHAEDEAIIPLRLNGAELEISGWLKGSTTYIELESAGDIFAQNAGRSVDISAKEGDCYIEALGRYIGGASCISIDGKIYAPIRSVVKVYGGLVHWQDEDWSVDIDLGFGQVMARAEDFYDADELYWMSRIINSESSGEPFEGQILVGNVVMNRVRSQEFPNSVYDVIFDDCYGVQFTPTANGTIYNDPDEQSIIAAKLVLEGYSLSDTAQYFLNPDLATNFWIPQNRPFLFKVGGHEFYS